MRLPIAQLGVTLVEVAVSTALVGLVLVAALETLGGAMRTLRQTGDSMNANTLAATLMAEVIALPYSDADGSTTDLGLEADEAAISNDRSLYDDVDDFHGWSRTPPESRDGTELAGYSGWKRCVEVSYLGATPVAGELEAITEDQGQKRVRVVVIDPQGVMTDLYAIRCPQGPNEAPAPFDATRVTAIEAQIGVDGGETVRGSVALNNLAESPSP